MYTSLHIIFQFCALQLSYGCVIDNSFLDKTTQFQYEDNSEIITSKLGEIVQMDTGYYDPKCIKYTVIKPNGDEIEINKNRITKKNNTELNYKEMFSANESAGEIIESRKFEEIGKTYKYEQLIIGPLKEEDHGNWFLAKYFADENCTVSGIIRTVTLVIIENIEPTHKTITIKEGGVLNISFPHAMPNLEMCFLTQPATTFDRYYDRDMTKPSNYCAYTLPNINQDDQGLWDVVAVGQIVYKTSVYVSVSQPSFWNKLDMLCRLMPWCRFGVITGRLPL